MDARRADLPFVRDRVAFEVQRPEIDVHIETGNLCDRANEVGAGIEDSELGKALQTVKREKLVIGDVELFQVHKARYAERGTSKLLRLSQGQMRPRQRPDLIRSQVQVEH